MFSDPKFTGTLTIEGFEYTKTYELVPIVFNKKIGQGWGYIIYSTVKNGNPELKSLGVMRMNGKFDEFVIWLFEPFDSDSKGTTDLILASPAASWSEAMALYDRLKN
ncbi:hypothetical protein [Paenibacillus sp. GCM10027626]|uniref:hypothetical protein n=1 Tax=Paenibacillus sp. GCM10027626 TaxID=3273411 RepID=UPI003630CB7C